MDAIEVDFRTLRVSGGIAGVVTDRSPLSALLSRAAVVIGPDATLADAVEAMETAGVSALLVEQHGGIITERDIARALGHGVPVDEPVRSIASPHPIVMPGTTTVIQACAVMLNEEVRHLLVDVDGAVGVLSLRDIAAALLQSADPQLWLRTLRAAVEMPAEIWLG